MEPDMFGTARTHNIDLMQILQGGCGPDIQNAAVCSLHERQILDHL